MTSRRKRIASLAIGLLATTMALACGSSSDDEASGSASTGSGNSTGGYCTAAAPGCLIETKLEDGTTYSSCIEVHTPSGSPPPTFQADCETPTGDPDESKTFLPNGCARDATMGCGLVTEVSGNFGVTFMYVSGNALIDDNNLCKTSCPNAASSGQPACCPGAQFP